MILCAALPHNDIPSLTHLSARPLDAKHLRVRIFPILCGSAGLLRGAAGARPMRIRGGHTSQQHRIQARLALTQHMRVQQNASAHLRDCTKPPAAKPTNAAGAAASTAARPVRGQVCSA